MGRLVGFIAGCIFITACGGVAANFPFRYYNLQAKSYEGTLVGDKEENDLPLSTCTPNAQSKSPCQVMLSAEVQRLKTAYRDLQLENEDLQRRCPAQ